jgi:hypothetical protein
VVAEGTVRRSLASATREMDKNLISAWLPPPGVELSFIKNIIIVDWYQELIV